MAVSLDSATKVNPRYYAGPLPRLVYHIGGSSMTCKKGQLGYLDTNGLAVACADDPAIVQFQFMETRATAASGTSIEVAMISPDTQYILFVTEAEADAAASRTMVGAKYTTILVSDVYALDIDTAASHNQDYFVVDGLMSDVDDTRYAVADVPGQVFGHWTRPVTRDGASS